MKDGTVKVVTPSTGTRRRRILLIPLFLGAVAFGFLLELSTYETLTLSEIRLTLANLPFRFRPARNSDPSSNSEEPKYFKEPPKLEEQPENETRVIPKTPQFWEQATLLDLQNFTWLVNNPGICELQGKGEENSRLMPILVHTARSHFQEREAIRRSFGSVGRYKNWVVRFIFLLGEADRGKNPQVNEDKFLEQQKSLELEQFRYGDLVVGSFVDSYHNLTYKHLMGFKWILNFCRGAEFVLKIDDDMFIDILRWLDWRSADLDETPKKKKIPDLYCHTFGGTKPIRERASKWYASEADWPPEYYPDYCSGWAYALTVDLIQRLYEATKKVKFFWVDDVYATGALMEGAKKEEGFKPEIKHIWGNVTTDIKEYRGLCDSGRMEGKREFRAVVYVPRGKLFERDMMCMWNKTKFDSSYDFT